MQDLEQLKEAIKKGNRVEAKRLTQEAISGNAPLSEVLGAMVAAMDDIGQKFQCNEIFVPEMLIASRAMKESMAILEPLLAKAGITPSVYAVIGTVQGDLHDIGKNLVAMMWKGANFGVIDLGSNVPAEKFIEAARTHNAKIIGLSALLTTTMPAMMETVKKVRESGLDVKIIIGGAPITAAFAKEVGADGFAADAAGAVQAVRDLVAV